MDKYVYFSRPVSFLTNIPDRPDRIINDAIKYNDFKTKYFPSKSASTLLGKVDSAATDLGAGIGLGTLAGGAQINKTLGRNAFGQGLKRIGANILTNPTYNRLAGYGLPILGGVGAVGAGLGAKNIYDKFNTAELPQYENIA